ncbi:DUF485 domain-containing protein [Actinokineospora bangkokensis]|uniref:Clumping factor B n=1 Tax=Actinokineospora bangkokensis TaxID=1193682 RepID=A0A1Q9LQI3_9PSEU|nr:DUF485 domain-containing protein [Actinokineospora bangkokensis]OLR94280.1 hypothetical protein BJP25_10910 [Actinokineospora bangkokensis]
MTGVATPPTPRRGAPRGEPGGATFGGIDAPAAAGPDLAALRDTPAFTALRSRFRRFAFPMTALFLAWYLGYVLLAAFAPQVMAIRVAGAVTVGLLLGLAQFASTLAITLGYARWARRRLDPLAAEVRAAAAARR